MPDVLTTARTVLRPLTPTDLEDLHEAVGADPGVNWSRREMTREETREALQRKLDHVRRHGFGMRAVVEREGGFLGYAGLQHLEDGPDVELGYYLRRSAWGRGLASEIARELVRHGVEDLGLARIVAVVRPDNTASQKVLANAGFHAVRLGHHYGADVQVWELDQAVGPATPA